MKLFASSLLVTALCTSASYAQYEGGQFGKHRWPHWYVGVQGGITFVDETDLSTGGTNAGSVDFDNGYGVGASIGYTPGPYGNVVDHMRFELEYFLRTSDLGSLDSGGTSTSLADEIASQSYMANVYYDFDTETRLVPYVGGGIGMSRVELTVPSLQVDDEDTAFTYQFMAGVAWQPEFMLNTVFQLGYRYLDAGEVSFTSETGTPVDHDYSLHGLEAGARFRF